MAIEVVAPTPVSAPQQDQSRPDHFILPKLVEDCTFPLVYHENGDKIAEESVNWLNDNCPDLNDKRRKALYGLQAGELTAFCYNTAEDKRLRVVSDFMNYLFHLDNISDGMMTSDTDALSDAVMNALWFTDFYRPTQRIMYKQPQEELNAVKLAKERSVTKQPERRLNAEKLAKESTDKQPEEELNAGTLSNDSLHNQPKEVLKTRNPAREFVYKQPEEELNAGKLARDFWSRCIPDAGPGCQARFKETLELFFEAVNIQAKARDKGDIPDLDSYIDVRRDTSGCKPCWALIEYALDIDLPDHVVEYPAITALNQATNDLVTWSNDIFSYNVEQARGDTHNMIVIFMKDEKLSLQQAVNRVGEMCSDSIKRFNENKRIIPIGVWGPEVDDMVKRYVQGLQDWIVGSLHWSFQTTRYFGTEGQKVKKDRIVKLLPVGEEHKW